MRKKPEYPKLIILEGPDGTGKTTLAQKLVDKLGGALRRHDAQPGKKELFPYFIESLRFAAESRKPVIFDRCWLSEAIYGAALRGGKDRVKLHARPLWRVARGLNAVMVQCLPAKDVVLHNWRATRLNQLPESEQKMEQIYDAYVSAFNHQELPVIKYDYRGATHPFDDAVTQLELQAKDGIMRNPGPGIGAWLSKPLDGSASPITLMVGETPGERDVYKIRRFDWPFVSDQGCSPWLHAQLDRAGIDERNLYWINAIGARGAWTKPAFVERLAPQLIVALGERARQWCLINGFAHYHVSHPQYWKRFHAKRPWFELDAVKNFQR